MARVDFEGLEELNRVLTGMRERAAAEVMGKALMAGAEILRAEAIRNAPRLTGTLRDNIIAKLKKKNRYAVSADVGPSKKAYYGKFVELGTTKMTARPFLFPAYQAKKDEIQREIADVLRQELGM